MPYNIAVLGLAIMYPWPKPPLVDAVGQSTALVIKLDVIFLGLLVRCRYNRIGQNEEDVEVVTDIALTQGEKLQVDN